jgi:hypothetical protein
MGLAIFRAMCLLVVVFGFGMWGIRKLLHQNPKVKDAVTDGVVSRIVRFFR